MKRIRGYRHLVPAIGVLLVLPLAGAASAAGADGPPTACEISKLPVPNPADTSAATNGSPSGRYHVGWNTPKSGDGTTPLLWDNGKLSTLDVPGTTISLHAVTDDGVVAGATYGEPDYIFKPFVYVGGKTTMLPGLTSQQGGDAFAISPNGDIAGTVDTGTNEWGLYPMRWNLRADGTYEVEQLSMPDGTTFVETRAIADDGTVVGVDYTRHVHYLWAWTPDGKRHRLSVPAGTVRPWSITASGTMLAADVEHADGDWTYLWDLSDMAAEPIKVSDQIGYVQDVNSRGWVVGNPREQPYIPTFASVESGDLRLPTLNDGTSIDEGADALSEDGTIIAGSSQDDNGNARAVRWSCS